MIVMAILAITMGGKCLHAPPINPKFSKRNCICTDSGALCTCPQGDCLCKDCPTRQPSTPVPAKAKDTPAVTVYRDEVNVIESWQGCPNCQRRPTTVRHGWSRR